MARRRLPAGRTFQKTINTHRWDAVSVVAAPLTAGATAITALGAGRPPETLLRTRGTGVAYADGVAAPPKLVQVSMGLVLVPQGQGTTVIWDPFSDPNAPWLWFQEVMVGYEEYVTDVIDNPGISMARFDVDSKAMRKAGDDEEIQFVVTNTTISGAISVNVVVAFRFLLGH